MFQRRTLYFALLLTLALALLLPGAFAQVPLDQISSDPFTNTDSQHQTEVEADTFSHGNTIVTAFQQGRFNTGGGSSDIGWATSLEGGATWQHGPLPGITSIEGSGPFDRATDPAVAFDAAHNTWLIATLPLSESGAPVPPMLISRSADGINWQNPVTVARNFTHPDKTWVACDNNSGSPFFGHCYAAWDDNGDGDRVWMSTSTDGGSTWGSPKQPAGSAFGLGGNPQIRPNGIVIVPSSDAFLTSEIAWGSRDGGNTWSSAVTIAIPATHGIAGGLRDLNLPTSATDASGRVFVAFHDCRYRTNCSSNDIVLSSSKDGKTWTFPKRVPIDPVSSTVDHFIPLFIALGASVEDGAAASTKIDGYWMANSKRSVEFSPAGE